jgi:hypothetical protein
MGTFRALARPLRALSGIRLTSAILCGLLFCVSPARAHGLGVWAEVEGSQVLVEAYFSNGKVARAGSVKVTDASGATLAEGKLSNDGRWSFPVPDRPTVLIHVEAGEAHSAGFELEIGTVQQDKK